MKRKRKSKRRTSLSSASSKKLINVFSHPSTLAEAGFNCPPSNPQRPRTRLRRAAARDATLQPKPGSLGKLPAEILQMIIYKLDYPSLLHLAATNSRFESYIKGLTCYKLIATYRNSDLRLMKRSGFFLAHDVGSVDAAFRESKCFSCGNPGHSLYLPTSRRYCVDCLLKAPLPTPLVQEFPFGRGGGILFPAIEDVATRLPLIDPESHEIDFVRHCRACEHSSWEWTQVDLPPSPGQQRRQEGDAVAARKLFTAAELLQHIRKGECRSAKRFWDEI